MSYCIPPDTKLADTGFGYTLSLIGGKYKMIVLYWLGEFGVLRHNALLHSKIFSSSALTTSVERGLCMYFRTLCLCLIASSIVMISIMN